MYTSCWFLVVNYFIAFMFIGAFISAFQMNSSRIGSSLNILTLTVFSTGSRKLDVPVVVFLQRAQEELGIPVFFNGLKRTRCTSLFKELKRPRCTSLFKELKRTRCTSLFNGLKRTRCTSLFNGLKSFSSFRVNGQWTFDCIGTKTWNTNGGKDLLINKLILSWPGSRQQELGGSGVRFLLH